MVLQVFCIVQGALLLFEGLDAAGKGTEAKGRADLSKNAMTW